MKPLLVAEEAENRSEGSLKSPRKRSLSPYTTPEMSKKTKLGTFRCLKLKTFLSND